MFKMNNTDTRTTSRFDILIVNFIFCILIVNISHFILVFQLLILSIYLLIGAEREIQNKMGLCTPKVILCN